MLTAKQMKLMELVSEGGLQPNAYRKEYDTSQMAPKMIWEEAYRLRRHPGPLQVKKNWMRKRGETAHAGPVSRG